MEYYVAELTLKSKITDYQREAAEYRKISTANSTHKAGRKASSKWWQLWHRPQQALETR